MAGLEVRWALRTDQCHHHVNSSLSTPSTDIYAIDFLGKVSHCLMRLLKSWWALELVLGHQRYSENNKHCGNLGIVAGYWSLKGSESGQALHCSHPSIQMLLRQIEAKCPFPRILLPVRSMNLYSGLYVYEYMTLNWLESSQSLVMNEDLAWLFLCFQPHCFLHIRFSVCPSPCLLSLFKCK